MKADEKTTVCHRGTCVTVEGDTARLINGLLALLAIAFTIDFLYNLLK